MLFRGSMDSKPLSPFDLEAFLRLRSTLIDESLQKHSNAILRSQKFPGTLSGDAISVEKRFSAIRR
jgi:hypothetical protein